MPQGCGLKMGERSLVDNEELIQANERAISDWYHAIKKLQKKDILARILDGYDKLPRNGTVALTECRKNRSKPYSISRCLELSDVN
ncbi:MAG: hypothetical protein ABJO67_16040, partial [Pseudoruegeria sp.]